MTTHKVYRSMEWPDLYHPGDFVLTHGDSWTSRFIRFGEAMRFHGSRYSWVNHAALITSASGRIIEAEGNGVGYANISKYVARKRVVIDSRLSENNRKQAIAFAESCVGESYGWLTIACIAFGLITNGRMVFGFQGQSICSGLVARSLEHGGTIFGRVEPADIMPSALYAWSDGKPIR